MTNPASTVCLWLAAGIVGQYVYDNWNKQFYIHSIGGCAALFPIVQILYKAYFA